MTERVYLGSMLCIQCGRVAKVYAFDQRSGNWLRLECSRGHWGDIGPDSALLPQEVWEKYLKLKQEEGL